MSLSLTTTEPVDTLLRLVLFCLETSPGIAECERQKKCELTFQLVGEYCRLRLVFRSHDRQGFALIFSGIGVLYGIIQCGPCPGSRAARRS